MVSSTSSTPSDPPPVAGPLLTGTRCRRCGRVSAPVQHFGCEQCGAHGADLEEVPLAGRGRVLAAVVVHEHPQHDVPTPAVIGSVLLDEGPVLRALLVDPGAAPDGGWAGRTVTAAPAGSAERPSIVFGPAGDAA